ncbi:MAG: SpoIIE family protein phosphatase [Clostridia bacterium]|nr:SpoIIE family protein phosphatase [Clostridia bacterium]
MSQWLMQYSAEIKLGIASLIPVLFAMLLYLLEQKTPFGRMKYWFRQIVIGLIFGGLAVLGTEWGIPMNGAQMNCRDAAVLTGGLMFGAPAGIIAGIIGGVERWFAVLWGIGTFTRVACSVSTLLAGFYAAALRKFMLENKKPGWLLSFVIGVVMEILHLTMIFVTNMGTPAQAIKVVHACTVPMAVANGVSVMLASVMLSWLSVGNKEKTEEKGTRISQKIQRWLLVTVLLAFAATSFFVFRLQDRIAVTQRDTLPKLALDETVADIHDASDEKMLEVSHNIASEVTEQNIDQTAKAYRVEEINMVDDTGHIFASNIDAFAAEHFDMASGEQSGEFLCLLDENTTEYVQAFGPTTRDASILRKYVGVKTNGGFVQVGYTSEQLQRYTDESVVGVTKNRHVGETGYTVILDDRQRIVSGPKNINERILAAAAQNLKTPEEGAVFELKIDNEDLYCEYRMAEGYCIMSFFPVAEALQLRNIALYVNAFMEILVFAVLFALIYMLIKKIVVNQIKRINGSLAKITDGNLDEVVNVRTSAEFASLSDDINSTVDTLKHYISEASARIDKELEFAKNIQESALPRTFPAFPKRKDFEIFASMDAAKEVGGDFYDFYMSDRDVINFLIADVSGKGIPAAMFMMRAKAELKHLTETGRRLSQVFTDGNQSLCEGNDAGMFVTAWQGRVDLLTGQLTYANAGHNPPLIRHKNGSFEYLKARAGFVLAGMDGIQYKDFEIGLQPGDTVYLYTDGVTEATNANNELFGEARLLETVNAVKTDSTEALCKAVRQSVDEFVGDAPQFDDITMVAFHYAGHPAAPSIHFEEAKLEDITAVTAFVEEELNKLDCPMKTVVQFSVAIDEIYSNIVRYGYADGTGPVTVEVIEREEPHAIHLRFTDHGIPYNPLIKEDPDVTLSAEERSIGGLGIFMVKRTMDDIRYKYECEQNILTITKILE